MWYDERMFSQKRICFLSSFLLLIMVQWGIGAASVPLGPPLYDSAGSQALLADWDFSGQLSESERNATAQLSLYLTTMGRGDPLYVWFGHSGLVVADNNQDRSVMYDYGIFSFNDDFYQTFALGRLNYEVWATSAPTRYAVARSENRDVSRITLNLPEKAKLEVVNFLNYNIQPEQNTYLYHHYRENCATRIRDIIDKAVDGQFSLWAKTIPMDETLRQLVMRHTYASPFIDWTLNFLQSGTIDKPISLWEAMFLPAILEQALLEFSYVNQEGELVRIATDFEVINSEPVGTRPLNLEHWKSMTLPSFSFSLAIALIALIFLQLSFRSSFPRIQKMGLFLYGMINFTWTFALGMLSILLLFMMTISSHDVTYWNENIVIVTPWLLVMAIQSIKIAFRNQRSLRRFRKANTFFLIVTVVLIILKGVFFDLLIQQNWQIIVTLLPLYLFNSSIPFERLLVRTRLYDDSDEF